MTQTSGGSADDPEADAITQAGNLLDVVAEAAAACPGSMWEDVRWSEVYIARVGGRFLRHESFMVMHPTDEGGEEARLCLYLHVKNTPSATV